MGWLIDEDVFWTQVRNLALREAFTALVTSDEAAVVGRFLDRFEKQRKEEKERQ